MDHLQQPKKFEYQIINHCNSIDISIMSPIRLFVLYDKSDRVFFEIFKHIFLPEKVIFVNDQYEIQRELETSGKIINKVDLFICLISRRFLLNIDLLKTLIRNFEETQRFIMLLVDETIYNTVNARTSIYNKWKSQMHTLESQGLYNDDLYNSFKTLENAKSLLPKYLDSLCRVMNTVTNKLVYFVDKLCYTFKSISNMDGFTRYNDEELKSFLNSKEKEIERSTNMSHTTQNITIQENNAPIIAPTGDNPYIDMRKNDFDLDNLENKLISLIDTAKKDLVVLDKDDADTILIILEDILAAVDNKNKKRLNYYLSNLSSTINICTNVPKLLGETFQNILKTAGSLFP